MTKKAPESTPAINSRSNTADRLSSLSSENESALYLFRVMLKAGRVLEEHSLRSTEALGICPSDFYILEALLFKGPLPMGTIAAKVLLTLGSLSVAVDRLETKGLVVRKAHLSDRRTRLIHLTKAGEKLVSSHFQRHADALTEAMAGLSLKEQSQATALVKKLGTTASLKLQA